MSNRSWPRVAGVSAIILAAITGAPATPKAQTFPSQDLHLVNGNPPGSGADVIVRFYGEKLRVLAGRTVIVDNKPGAGNNIATEYVARSKPDGHTIYMHTGSAMAAAMHIYRNPPVDAARELQVVAPINRQAYMIVVHPSKPWKSIGELTAYLKQKGDKATYAIDGNSGAVMTALYKEHEKLPTIEVAYRQAADCLNDLASGAVDFASLNPQFVLAQAREGRLRILGIASGKRLQSVPDLPTMAEQGVPMDLIGWFAAFVPIATPRPVVDQLNKWFNAITSMDDTVRFLNQAGGDAWTGTPEDGQARLVSDIKAWGDYIRLAKIPQQG
jgi:tripartite-type tricarboxylate transporter receptor subunit TctC